MVTVVDPGFGEGSVEVEDLDSELPLILVVDDNQDIRQYLKQEMSEFYDIIEAEDGVKALSIAKEII